ncbi:MAG: hypothetical protein QNJ97_20410 [Myxococcota bacterium]|nr:hypothetical protein [Myxococcota bacterium]
MRKMVFLWAIATASVATLGLMGSGQAQSEGDSVQGEPGEPGTEVNLGSGSGLDISRFDGDFHLSMKVFGQMLYTASESSGDWTQALALRRARLYFLGNFFGKHNKYYVQLAFSPQDMKFKNGVAHKSPIFDWYFKFDYLRDLTFQVGQYRVPFNKSRVIPYCKLQFVDRTAANFEFNLDRDIGFELQSADLFGLNLLRYRTGIFIGEGRDGYGASDFGMLYVARLEVHLLGLFNDYVEADLKRRQTPRFAIGAAYAFLDEAKKNQGINGSVPSDGGTTDIHTATADVAFKFLGISLSSEVYVRKSIRSPGGVQALDQDGNPMFEGDGITPIIDVEGPRSGLGWFVQVGWLLPEIPVELAARYGQVHPWGDNSEIEQIDELGGAVNWYVFGPSIALKADYHYRFAGRDPSAATNEIRLSLQAGF